MKITKDLLNDLIKEEKEKRSFLLAKPAAEYEMAKKLFEEQSASGGEFTEVAFNTMMAMSVFMDGSLDESTLEESQQHQLEFSLPNNPNPQVIKRFMESLYSGSRSGFLTYYKENDLASMHLYLIKGHNAGFALKDGNDIVSVHNNSSLSRLGKYFLKTAVAKGGTKLDHFDGFLSGLYRKNGFMNVYEVYQWDEQYKPASWTYDKVDIFDRDKSIYADALNEMRRQGGEAQISLPNERVEVIAEDDYKITINPNEKYNQYLYGRPDVIFRRL